MPISKPFVTVVVTAFRRREYLRETLKSLEEQTAGKESFEVVVVKDFNDPETDLRIERNGWTAILNTEERLGPFITEAVKSSSGEILAFLDDDDLFEKDKLERVADIFRTHPEVGYYHNSATFIDEAGNEVRAPYAFNFSTSKEPDGESIIGRDDIRRSINRMIHLRHDFNRSSISIRKDILLRHMGESMKMESAYDSFMFFCAVLSDYSLMVDSRRLTRYRFNRKSVSISSTFGFSSRQIRTYTLMHDMAMRTGSKDIANLLERQILFFKTINAIHSPMVSRREVMKAAVSFIRHENSYSRMGNTFAGVLSMTYMLSPRLSKRLYSKLTAPET